LETELVTALTHIGATGYLHVAGLALLLWDYFLTLDLEIRFFWRREWSWPRVLFFY